MYCHVHPKLIVHPIKFIEEHVPEILPFECTRIITTFVTTVETALTPVVKDRIGSDLGAAGNLPPTNMQNLGQGTFALESEVDPDDLQALFPD